MSTEPTRYAIFVNGPPGVGKDTAVRAIEGFVWLNADWMRPRHLKFAETLKDACHRLYGVPYSWNHYDRPENEAAKNTPCAEFMGLSPRQAYIQLSERYVKEFHNKDFFGWMVRRKIRQSQGCALFLFSDSGFVEEALPVIALVGQQNCLVIELSADGKTFEGDSRGYTGEGIRKHYPKVKVQKIHNPIGDAEDKELFKILCCGAAKAFLKIEERD